MKTLSKILVSFWIILILLIPASSLATNQQKFWTSASAQTQGFQIVNAIWGTNAAPVSVAPGDHDVSLTITTEYTFSATATTIQGLLSLPSGFSLYNGSSNAFSSVSGTFPSGSTVQMTFQGIFLASSLNLGNYVFPLNITWTAAGYSYVLWQLANIKISVLGRPQLYPILNETTLAPAQVNTIPLVISNNGSGSASDIIVEASSQQAGILNTIPEITSLQAGSQVSEELEVYVPSSTAGDVVPITISMSYKDPYGNSESSSQELSTYVSQLGQPRLEYETAQQTLSPGRTNSVNLTLTNTGTIPLYQISTSVSTQSQSESVTGTFPYVQSLQPGNSISSTIGIYVTPAASNSAFSITLATSFVETNGMSATSSQTLGFSTSNYISPVTNFSIAVGSVSTSLSVGSESPVSFQIKNLGRFPVYSPTIALSVSNPLVLSGNSSFSAPSYVIPAGGSMTFEAMLSSSPTATPGSYSGQLTVAVFDQNGDSYENTFNVGFTLLGTIEFVVQGEQLSQTGSNFTISGTLLNEGTASAYYTYMVASVSSGSPGPSSYVGEVDPNTPLPFSTSASLPSGQSEGSSIPISLTFTFKDSFGTNRTAVVNSSIPISSVVSTTTTSTSPHRRATGFFGLLILIIIVIVVVVVSITALRRRSSASKKARKSQVV